MEFLLEVVLLGLILNLGAGVILGFIKNRWLQGCLVSILCLGLGAIVAHHFYAQRELVIVPAVEHMFQDEAERLCIKQGLKPKIKRQFSSHYRAGEIVSQSLYPGSPAEVGKVIELTVSTGSPVEERLEVNPCSDQVTR
jgi:hypothetical protein